MNEQSSQATSPAMIRSKPRSVLRWLIAVVILGLMAMTASEQLSKVRQADFQFHVELVVISILCLLAALTAQFLGWVMIIRRLDQNRLPFPSLAKNFVAAWASRYIPLGVTPFFTKFIYGRSLGVEPAALGMSMVLENVLGLAAVCLTALFLLPSAAFPLLHRALAVWLAAVVATCIVWPQSLVKISIWLLARMKSQPTAIVRLSWRDTSRWLLLYVLTAVLGGAGFYFLLGGLLPLRISFLAAAGLYNAASFAGLVMVFAPAGLGVREAVLAGLLLPWFPWPVGVVLAAASRIWTIVADILWLGVVWFVAGHQSHPPADE